MSTTAAGLEDDLSIEEFRRLEAMGGGDQEYASLPEGGSHNYVASLDAVGPQWDDNFAESVSEEMTDTTPADLYDLSAGLLPDSEFGKAGPPEPPLGVEELVEKLNSRKAS